MTTSAIDVTAGVDRRRRPSPSTVLAVAGTLLFVVAWELTGRAGVLGRGWIPLSDIVGALTDPDRRVLYQRAANATFGRAALGLAIGLSCAAMAATLASLVPATRALVERAAVSLNAIPWIALGPLLMIMVSRNMAPAVIAALAVFFPAFTSIATGLGATRSESLDLFASLGARRVRTFALVRAPGSLPMLLVALKLAAPAAIVGAIFGEWFGADRGLGLLLLTSMQRFDSAQLWAVAFMAGGVAAVLYVLFGGLETMARRRFGGNVIEEAPPSNGRADRLRSFASWAAVVVVLVALWHGYVARSGISALLVPAPIDVLDALTNELGAIASDTLVTLRIAMAGLLVGTTLGAVLAIITCWSPLLRGLVTPIVLLAHAVPTLALLPVVAGMFGYNDRSLLAIAVLISFFPSFVFTDAGLRDAPGADLMGALGVGRFRRFAVVALPATVPHVAVAMRISAGLCVIAAVVAEFIIGRAGLGRSFNLAYGRSDIALAWAIALVILAMSVIAFAAARTLERVVHRRFA